VTLTIGEDEAALLVCPRHADWLRAYAEEDAAVHLVDHMGEPQAVAAEA
jgi:hypothetical protein